MKQKESSAKVNKKQKTVSNNDKLIVASLGGSIVIPSKIDTEFVKKFIEFVKKKISQGYKLLFYCGGGMYCREYQAAYRMLMKDTGKNEEEYKVFVDEVGVASTYLNAAFFLNLFLGLNEKGIKLNPIVLTRPDIKVDFTKYNLAFGCGFEPGRSTDFDAAHGAIVHGGSLVINLSNQDYVFDKDPKLYKEAKPIIHMTWSEYDKVLDGKKWTPGLNVPFDPTAAQHCKEHKLTVILIRGTNLTNFEAVIDKKPYVGTTISPLKS